MICVKMYCYLIQLTVLQCGSQALITNHLAGMWVLGVQERDEVGPCSLSDVCLCMSVCLSVCLIIINMCITVLLHGYKKHPWPL